MNPVWLRPGWPAPRNVKALCTTRQGGASVEPYHSWNLAGHVGDDAEAVKRNRKLLKEVVELPQEPFWMDQQHTDVCIQLPYDGEKVPVADAAWSNRPEQLCTVMTADCLPILLCDLLGTKVAAVHAGWRGVHQRIIDKSVREAGFESDQFIAWIGPAIHQKYFEVGEDVYQAFCDLDPNNAVYFKVSELSANKYFADLIGIAKQQLFESGCKAIYGGDMCSYADKKRFFSYRRDGQSGRMASIIWLDQEASAASLS
ncbi:peptidoglycan editing factor PgeF [Thiomicrorhabdus sp.]|uniref:peptidoglycan editing factor PgeF n=1 Tax=Thiomicrorhabdus sp. TaxID=2039724 RepID=UPI0029C7447C|nr:peptidoglycan editing factor PgeF [Thiomicrorhabdus sp.]